MTQSNKGMNKFEAKAFECEVLSAVYNLLEDRKDWYKMWDNETEQYIDSNQLDDIEKIKIISDIQKAIEKML